MSTGDAPAQRASDAFVAELARWRQHRGMSKKQLAAAMGFDPSYVSHVEARRHRPTEDFARRAEAVLHADGAVWQRYREYDDLRAQPRVRPVRSAGIRRYRSSGCHPVPGSSSSRRSPNCPTSATSTCAGSAVRCTTRAANRSPGT